MPDIGRKLNPVDKNLFNFNKTAADQHCWAFICPHIYQLGRTKSIIVAPEAYTKLAIEAKLPQIISGVLNTMQIQLL